MDEEGTSDQFTYKGEAVDLTAPTVRLDLTTGLEITLLLLSIFAGLGVILLPLWELPLYSALISLCACVAFAYLFKHTDCTYVLDNMRKRIDYHRSFLGQTTQYPVCRFDEVETVVIEGSHHQSKHSSWWEYTVVLIVARGEKVVVSDGMREDLSGANRNGALLAKHLGCPFTPGKEHHVLEVKKGPGGAKLSVEVVPYETAVGTWIAVALVIFFVIVIVTIVFVVIAS